MLLQWEWPVEATTAQLEIEGMNSSSLVDFTEVTSNYLWHAFAGNVPSSEDIYNLSLVFYAGGEDLNQTLNARLAIVKGAFEAAVVDFGPSEKKWGKVCDNVVISYDAG